MLDSAWVIFWLTGLAILADCLGDGERALRLHQAFKEDFIANEPEEGFVIFESEIREWARELSAVSG